MIICIPKLVDIFLPRSCVLLIFLNASVKSIQEMECIYNYKNSMIFSIIVQGNFSNLGTNINLENFKLLCSWNFMFCTFLFRLANLSEQNPDV
jgi:hypothetical protein